MAKSKPELRAPNSEPQVPQTWKITLLHLDEKTGEVVGAEAETHFTRPDLVDASAVERFVAEKWKHVRFVRADRFNRWDVTLVREQVIPIGAAALSSEELAERVPTLLPGARRLVKSERTSLLTADGKNVLVWKATIELGMTDRMVGDYPDAASAGTAAVLKHPGWMAASAQIAA